MVAFEVICDTASDRIAGVVLRLEKNQILRRMKKKFKKSSLEHMDQIGQYPFVQWKKSLCSEMKRE